MIMQAILCKQFYFQINSFIINNKLLKLKNMDWLVDWIVDKLINSYLI
jgi:hypothetical protein